MSDMLADTPRVGRQACPGCECLDLAREVIDVMYCDTHAPARDGAEDARVDTSTYLSGTAESGGEGNRRMCALIHGATR